jgi:prepilin-type processing-associated H-X9-DG protein
MDPKGDIDFEIAKKGINKDKNGIGSPGQGGVNTLFGDGSVSFLPETTDPQVIEKFINPNDGQYVERPNSSSDTRPERPRPMPKPRKANTVNSLRQLALAVHNYHDAYLNGFPSVYAETKEKKPLHSWRVALLPYLEEVALYQQIRWNEPWDSEYNKQFHDKMPPVYVSSGLTPEEIAKGHTTFAVIWGEKAPFQPNKWNGFHNIPDGTSNTGMIFQRKTSFCWMDPTADIPYDVAIKGLGKDDKGIGAPDKDRSGKKGTYCTAFDASVHFLPEDFDPKSLEAIICGCINFQLQH